MAGRGVNSWGRLLPQCRLVFVEREFSKGGGADPLVWTPWSARHVLVPLFCRRRDSTLMGKGRPRGRLRTKGSAPPGYRVSRLENYAALSSSVTHSRLSWLAGFPTTPGGLPLVQTGLPAGKLNSPETGSSEFPRDPEFGDWTGRYPSQGRSTGGSYCPGRRAGR